jgi:hypothetical protein
MVIMHTWKNRILLGVFALLVVFVSGCSKKYAVLISTNEVVSDDVAYHSEWWYDLFLNYQMLRDNGFTDDRIFVLYGNGSDFNTVHPKYNAMTQFGHTITDMAMSKANIQAVFNDLQNKVKSRDFLYVWWMGHGGGSGPGSCNLSMSISNTGEHVSDIEFTNFLNTVTNYRKRSVAVMTCHSGGLVDNLDIAGTNTLVLTSSTCPQSSYDATTTCNGLFHAEFNYTLPNALRMKNPCGTVIASDSNNNTYVSLAEAHQYNLATMTTSTPQMGDADTLAAATEIQRGKP